MLTCTKWLLFCCTTVVLMEQAGVASSRWHQPGYVYVMRGEGNRYKIGYSNNPERRLGEIRRSARSNNIHLLSKTWVPSDASQAETAAQLAVRTRLGMSKVSRSATDWYRNSRNVRESQILDTVRSAVYNYNRNRG